MIPMLEPLFQGPLAPHGEALQCAPQPPVGALRVADLLQSPPLLDELLDRHAAHLGVEGKDRRAVASAWSLDYLSLLLPPVAAAASVLKHGFPVAAEQVWVLLDADARPRSFHIRDLGLPQHGATTEARYAALLRDHLAPLFGVLSHLTGIAAKILWGNTARRLEPVLDQALTLTGLPGIASDRQMLLHTSAWPGWDNPLPGRQREVRVRIAGRDTAITLHRQCCLFHLLPCEAHCGACPLSPAHR